MAHSYYNNSKQVSYVKWKRLHSRVSDRSEK